MTAIMPSHETGSNSLGNPLGKVILELQHERNTILIFVPEQESGEQELGVPY
jgi:hypothetical protein